MDQIIGVTDLQRRFRPVFDQVAEGKVAYVLTRGSRPQAALIPYEEYLEFQRLQEGDVLARYDRLRDRLARENAAYSDEEVEADLRAADEELKGRA